MCSSEHCIAHTSSAVEERRRECRLVRRGHIGIIFLTAPGHLRKHPVRIPNQIFPVQSAPGFQEKIDCRGIAAAQMVAVTDVFMKAGILNENIMGWTRIKRKEIQCQYKRIRKQENGCARFV